MEVFRFNNGWTEIVVACFLVLLAYLYFSIDYGFWKSRGIPGPKPYPLFGTWLPALKKGMEVYDKENIEKYGTIYGEFMMSVPALMIADPAILREVLVKEFPNFSDHNNASANLLKYQYAVRKFLTVLRGEEWKRVRNTLTPAFSASKMRLMTKQINQCVDILIDNLMKMKNEQLEVKKSTDCFTFDVIARVGFGVELDSQKDPKNKFVKHGRKIFDQGFSLRIFFVFLISNVPVLFPLLAKLFPKFMITNDVESIDFFVDIIRRIIKGRQEGASQGSVDLIQLMLNAHKLEQKAEDVDHEIGEDTSKQALSTSKGLTEEEVLGQSLLIFLAGFDTTSGTMSYLLYNLATNPECQEKVREEVDKVVGEKTEITYDMTHQFPYLEMCIQETLRLFPPAVRTDRHCVKEMTINNVTIPAETMIGVPVYCLHHNPELWPEPEVFRPERFSAEEKANRDAFCYMPFGMGPRNCIGMRLAQMELRISTARILQNFNLKTCDKTQIPLQVKSLSGFLKPKDGIFIVMEPRMRNS